MYASKARQAQLIRSTIPVKALDLCCQIRFKWCADIRKMPIHAQVAFCRHFDTSKTDGDPQGEGHQDPNNGSETDAKQVKIFLYEFVLKVFIFCIDSKPSNNDF